jgi:hypothetical protein
VFNEGPLAVTVSSNATTEVDGLFELYLVLGTYNLQIKPPSGTRYTSTNIEIILSGDVSQDITLEKQLLLTELTAVDGQAKGMSVLAIETSGVNQGNKAYSDNTGSYEVALFPGNYNIRFKTGISKTGGECLWEECMLQCSI